MSNECPFCEKKNVAESRDSVPGTWYVKCSSCGEFQVEEDLCRKVSPAERDKCKVLLRVRKLRGLGRISLLERIPKETRGIMFDLVEIGTFLKQWPSGSRFFDEILINLSFLEPTPGKTIRFEPNANNGHIRPWAYVLYDPDCKGAQKFPIEGLCDTGFIKLSGSHYMITAKGWERIESLRNKDSGTAFVAMWFDVSKKSNIKREVEKAVASAGYNPESLTVDDVEHNEYIMDKVINLIDESRFVIADFTCIPEGPIENGKIKGGSRGGVYFEAGYAKGKGKEVLLTCRNDDDSKFRRHFDIEQINTIFWEEDGDQIKAGGLPFSTVLANRIIATVGRGPLLTRAHGCREGKV